MTIKVDAERKVAEKTAKKYNVSVHKTGKIMEVLKKLYFECINQPASLLTTTTPSDFFLSPRPIRSLEGRAFWESPSCRALVQGPNIRIIFEQLKKRVAMSSVKYEYIDWQVLAQSPFLVRPKTF